MIEKSFDDLECCAPFSRFRLQDIDGNGSVNLIRDSKTSPYGEGPIFDWEWNGSKFIAQF